MNDIALRNCMMVNVFSGEIQECDILIKDGKITGFTGEANRDIDLDGKYVCPGFIDPHVHIESSYLRPPQYARLSCARGVTTCLADCHEVANVLGMRGVEYMVTSSQHLPMTILYTAPSCVPSSPYETNGATLTAQDIEGLYCRFPSLIVGLGEVMNYPAVLNDDIDMHNKLKISRGRLIEGHAPMLRGAELDKYISCGIGSDHECVDLDEAYEKMQKGMHIFIRYGTYANNFSLIRMVNDNNFSNFSFATDDCNVIDLFENGSIDRCVKLAIKCGIPPVRAIQMATINPARYMGLSHAGAIAPGYKADLVICEDLNEFEVDDVYVGGVPIMEAQFRAPKPPIVTDVMGLPQLNEYSFDTKKDRGVIRVIPQSLITEHIDYEEAENPVKMAVIERYGKNGNIGTCYGDGINIGKGAVASTVCHDHHNVIVAGHNDKDMELAVKAIASCKGGFAAVADGNVIATVPLPVAGLMSDEDALTLRMQIAQFRNALIEELEADSEKPDPIGSLAFVGLPVIPHIKLTDKGPINVK